MINEVTAEQVAERLRLAMGRMVRRVRRETDGRHSPASISALSTIRRLGAPTLGEVALAEGVSRPTMTVQAAALEGHGLIQREADASDRRAVKVRLTAKGARVLQASRRRRNAYLATRLQSLKPDELRTLDAAAAILERLLEDGH